MPSARRASSRMRFSKWHGLGNDYLLVERAELAVPLAPERVRRICDYHFGVGSGRHLGRVDGPHELTVGVWERGAGETLSSGTSSVAAAAAAAARGWCESPVTVHLVGGDLQVQLEGGRAILTGPAEEICTVELAEEFRL